MNMAEGLNYYLLIVGSCAIICLYMPTPESSDGAGEFRPLAPPRVGLLVMESVRTRLFAGVVAVVVAGVAVLGLVLTSQPGLDMTEAVLPVVNFESAALATTLR